jgi:hypothetical protein
MQNPLSKMRQQTKKVQKVKPKIIPEIKGRAARNFQANISKPPTEKHKQIEQEAEETFKKVKRVC